MHVLKIMFKYKNHYDAFSFLPGSGMYVISQYEQELD